MPHSPRVDVVLPVFNAAATIEQAVRSVLDQEEADLRLFAIDDGSTDDTPAILSRLARGDARMVVERQENSGIVDALNRGCGLGAAPYIARQDADDISYPDRFGRQLAYLSANPACVAVSSAARHIDASGRPIGTFARFRPPDCADPHWFAAREPILMHPFLMVRRAVLEQIGGYRYVFHAEDADLYWRLQEVGTLANMDDVLGDYRLHAMSVSSRSVVNGRVQALSSQLAARSTMRRRAGQADICFPREARAHYERATSLHGMVELARVQLSASEADWLALAVAEKLMELASYRPYELDQDDCVFISQAVRLLHLCPSGRNRAEIRKHVSGTSARLLAAGRFREAGSLCPPSLYVPTFARAMARILAPQGLRRSLRPK